MIRSQKIYDKFVEVLDCHAPHALYVDFFFYFLFLFFSLASIFN